MTIHKKSVKWTKMPKTVIRDSRLNWNARGVYAYLSSFGQDAVHTLSDVVKGSAPNGRQSTVTGIKQLLNHGYLSLSPFGKNHGRYICKFSWHLFK